jgi:hypothetical protein
MRYNQEVFKIVHLAPTRPYLLVLLAMNMNKNTC